MKRRKSKGFAWALAEYLLSDSYMYAPLVASPPFPSPASNGEPDASPVRRDYLAPSLLTGSGEFLLHDAMHYLRSVSLCFFSSPPY
ncbi:hypothetical protein AXF42_Ash005792 [Apostasia shenzhenica]|uniref:Uncharacterized protein n=1 Tax=Apostasia shenzhenica TaxID=1088818 RepID=A0A2I0BCD7_9ASPA|nr:hypothetical protein AXF42_Ash005792 [Apostasia shenzhenica]